MRLLSMVAVSSLLLIVQPCLRAEAPVDTSSKQPASVVIVELFTSEGCSSCPPADALLQKIHLKQTRAGQLIVGLSEHVTYWDRLGWKDPYSEQTFTDRQGVYASRLSPEGSYTPQMVLNGRAQFVGSNGAALEDALRVDSLRKHPAMKVLSSTRQDGGLNLTLSLQGFPSKKMDLIAVLTDDVDSSNVLRGENSGRSLQHVSVVRSLYPVATVQGDTRISVRVGLPDTFQHGRGSGHHVVVFAQEADQGEIVGATIMPI